MAHLPPINTPLRHALLSLSFLSLSFSFSLPLSISLSLAPLSFLMCVNRAIEGQSFVNYRTTFSLLDDDHPLKVNLHLFLPRYILLLLSSTGGLIHFKSFQLNKPPAFIIIVSIWILYKLNHKLTVLIPAISWGDSPPPPNPQKITQNTHKIKKYIKFTPQICDPQNTESIRYSH